ncbi:MAG TPA: PilZ domain-containing protein [Rhodobacterales bacterium]|nr:PilZ domain-containing protein [Rhodobacterales bacterium]
MRFRATRWACNMPARAQRGGRQDGVEIVNISTTGARLNALATARPGERLALRIRDTEMIGVVAWANGRGVGVRFQRELSQTEVFAIRQAVSGPRRANGPQRGAWGMHGFHELE